jgi:hypothetical protein
MSSYDPLIITQPDNKLSKIAEAERAKLLPKNDYKDNANEYTVTNPDAIADGDIYGKGTGQFLDTGNQSAGSSVDIGERKFNIKGNPYQPNKPYTTPGL